MIKIRFGGYPFNVPQRWEEVSKAQAKRLAETSPEQIHERLSILAGIPGPRFLSCNSEPLLAAYEVVSFIEEIPELVSNKVEVPDIGSGWSFMEFEAARQLLLKHSNELGVCLYSLAEIKSLEANFLEAGCKILDQINDFLEQWGVFDLDEDDEPSALEEAAGIDRLQMFGVYPMLKDIAKRFGMKPSDVEKEPVGWVYMEYFEDREEQRFQANYQKLAGA